MGDYTDDSSLNVKKNKMSILWKIVISFSVFVVLAMLSSTGYNAYVKYTTGIQEKENARQLALQEEERIAKEIKNIENKNREYTQNLNWVDVAIPSAKSLENDGWEFYRLKHKDMFYTHYKKENHAFIDVTFRATSSNGNKYELEFEEKIVSILNVQYGEIVLNMIDKNGKTKKSAICEMNSEKWRMSANMSMDVETVAKITRILPHANIVNCVINEEKVSFNVSDWKIFKFNEFSPQKGL